MVKFGQLTASSFCCCSRAELRKEKAERAPGGVTPGDEDYYASVMPESKPAAPLAAPPAAYLRQPSQQASSARAGSSSSNMSSMSTPPSAAAATVSPALMQNGSRNGGHGPSMTAQEAAGFDITGEEAVEDLMLARDDLMDSILQDEEEIIAMHRQQIEESMEIVRK